MKHIKELSIGDLLTLKEDLDNLTHKKQRVVYGINASPENSLNPSVLVLNDFGYEQWVYLRSFEGYEDMQPTIDYPSLDIH